MRAALDHIDTWIFDLDNTLYPASCDLFALIDARMNLYLRQLLGADEAEAHRIQKRYFYEHGTTLSGLMALHGTDPHHFLDFVHDIDLDRVSENPELRAAISALPGRKIVFTNGDVPYAERVLNALGLGSCFEAVHDIHATLLHLMGIDPMRFSVKFQGLDNRLTGVEPARVVTEILA